MQQESEGLQSSATVDHSVAEPKILRSAYFNAAVCAISIALSAALVLRLIYLVLSTGNVCLTNDYQYLLPIVDGILSPSIDWKMVINECFENSHFLFLPTLFCCFNAAMFEWNIKIDCIVGIVLAALRCLLFFDCLTLTVSQHRSRWIVLLSIFALTFGSTALSCYDFGQASITGGIGMLGFALGVWATSKYPGLLKGDILMLLSGIVVALCAGYWIPAWCAFGVVLLMCRVRTLRTWSIFAIGLGLSAIPTLLHLGMNSGDAPKLVAYFNWPFILNTLGRCFAKRIGVTSEPLFLSQLGGWIAICSLFVFSLLAPIRRSDSRYAAALGVSIFGCLSIWLTSLFRTNVAPWYAGFAVFVWIGIAGLAALCVSGDALNKEPRKKSKVFKWAGIALFLGCGCLYLMTNLKTQDMDFWAETRSEATDSCVRNFSIAPTYAERTVFLGHVGDFDRFYKLSEVLRRRHWSTFATHQVWSLQGDFILPTVAVHAGPDESGIRWVSGTNAQSKKSWNNPEHLNLALQKSASVSWKLTVPANAIRAEFKTKLLASSSSAATVRASSGSEILKSFSAKVGDSILIDLMPYKGRKIEIYLSAEPGPASNSSTVFERPIVEIADPSTREKELCVPSNTSKSEYFPRQSADDIVLTSNRAKWDESDLKRSAFVSDRFVDYTTTGSQPKLTLKDDLSVSPRQFSHFVFEVKADSKVKVPRAACIGFVVNRDKLVQKIVPLLPTEGLQGYAYELKLLELESTDRITGLEILPVYVRPAGESLAISIGDIRFSKFAQ